MKSRTMIIIGAIMLVLLGLASINMMHFVQTGTKQEISHSWTDGEKNDIDGQGAISVKFKDRDDRYVNVQNEAFSFLFGGMEISKIEITVSYIVEGTNIDVTTLNVDYGFTISHNLDTSSSSVYATIVEKSLTGTKLQDSYTYTVDLEAYFAQFLNNEEAQTEHSFNLKIDGRFAVKAYSEAGQLLTADDSISGTIPLVWSPDTISITGSFTESSSGSTTTTETGGGKTSVLPYSLFGGNIDVMVAVLFIFFVTVIVILRRGGL